MRKFLTAFVFLCAVSLPGRSQSLEEVIRLAQDSTIMAFQSRYEYESLQAHYAWFEALRKPQLTLQLRPNYYRMITDSSRDYVYLRNFDRFSAQAQLMLTQKVLPWGGDAYVGTQALWSEYFLRDNQGRPRDIVATPLVVGYQQSILGYNPFRWEKAAEDQRLEAARKEYATQLYRIAEFNSINSSVNCNTERSCPLAPAKSLIAKFPTEKFKSFVIFILLISLFSFSICSYNPFIFKFKLKFSACCFDKESFNFLISSSFKSNFF